MSSYYIYARKKPENFDFKDPLSNRHIEAGRGGEMSSNVFSYMLHVMPGCCGFWVLNSLSYNCAYNMSADEKRILWGEFSNLLYNALRAGNGDINYSNYSYLFYHNRQANGLDGARCDLLQRYETINKSGNARNYILTDAYYPGESDFKNPALNRVFRFYRDTKDRKGGVWDVHHTGYHNRNSEKHVTTMMLSLS